MNIKKWIKSHKEIVTLIVLPLVLTGIAIGTYVLPTAFKIPEQDFVYVKCDTYCRDGADYTVRTGRISLLTDNSSQEFGLNTSTDETFYRYDMGEHTSRVIQQDELHLIEVDETKEAEDGFVVEISSGGSAGFLFYSDYGYDNQQFYAINGAARIELDIESRSFGTTNFIGWVVSDGR